MSLDPSPSAAIAVDSPRSALIDLISALHAGQDREVVARAVARGVRLLSGANSAALFVADQGHYRCSALDTDGSMTEAADRRSATIAGKSSILRDLRTAKQVIHLSDASESPQWRELGLALPGTENGYRWEAWPLFYRDEFMGFVEAIFAASTETASGDSAQVQRFVNEAAVALNTAALLEERSAEVARTAQLLSLLQATYQATHLQSVTMTAINALGPALDASIAVAAIEQHGSIRVDAHYTASGDELEREVVLALQPILMQALFLRRTIEGRQLQEDGDHLEDVVRARLHTLLRAGIRNLLVVPVCHGEERLGVLAFLYGDAERSWKSGDRSLVEQAAVLLAEVIVQLRQRQQATRMGAKLEAERHLLQAVVEQVPVGIVVDEPLGGPVVLNAAARQLSVTGQDASEEPRFEAYRQDGSPLPVEDLPRVQVQRNQKTSSTLNLLLRRRDGRLANTVWQSTPLRDDTGREMGTLSLLRDVASIRQAEQWAEERERQLVIYEAIVAEILAAPSIGEALSAIVPQLRVLLPFDALSISLLDAVKESMHRVAAVGSLPRLFADDENVALSQSIGRQVIETGTAQIFPDLSAAPGDEARTASQAGVHACMVVPILVEQRTAGTLNILSRQPSVYEQQHLAFASQIALLVGTAIGLDRRADTIRREAIDEERERLAREIHDTLAQTITGVVMQLDLVFRGLQSDNVMRSRVEQARTMARTALNEARRTVWNLRTGSADLSNVHALFQEESSDLERLIAVRPDIITVGEHRPVAPEIGAVLQRLARVALENVRTHSRAEHVRILIEFEPQRLKVTIEDNGQGFDPEKVNIEEGQSRVGLAGAAERVRHVGGSLRIESAAGHGTRVIAELPYTPAEPTTLTPQPATPASPVVAPEVTGPVTRILLIDDHTMVRQGLERMLQDKPDLVVIGSEATGADGLRRITELQPDVVLCDLQLPDMSGVEVIGKTRTHFPQVKCLVVTTYDSDDYIYEGIKAGAKGYVLKDVSSEELVKAVRAAARGESLLQPVVAKRLVERFADMARQDGAVEALTEREVEVLKALATGARNKEIAFDLGLSESTIKTHLASIFGKLGVTTRTEAVARGRELGLISL